MDDKMITAGDTIGLMLQAKTDKYNLEEMIAKLRQLVDEYGYKIGTYGKWDNFKKFVVKGETSGNKTSPPVGNKSNAHRMLLDEMCLKLPPLDLGD